MSRIFLIVFCLSLLSLGGCNGSGQQSKPIWEDVKLSDLAPAPGSQKPSPKISTVNIQIHVFEIPAENTEKLDEISKTLSLQPFRFNQYNSFTANGFAAGFGRISSSDRILELLNAAGGKKATSISLLLENGRTDYVPIIRLFAAKSIFYTSPEGTTDLKSIGPGRLSLRITAQKNPVFRGTYTITAVPAIPSALLMPGVQIPDAAKSDDTVFDSCSFNLQFSPGDFIFLRPVKYAAHGNSLGSLFFSRPGIRPLVLAFLIVCTNVIE
jgi:hypothetical protein